MLSFNSILNIILKRLTEPMNNNILLIKVFLIQQLITLTDINNVKLKNAGDFLWASHIPTGIYPPLSEFCHCL